MKYYFTHETSLPIELKNSNWTFERFRLQKHNDNIDGKDSKKIIDLLKKEFERHVEINKNSHIPQPSFTPTRVISNLLQLMDLGIDSQNNIVTANIEIYYYLQILKKNGYINFKDAIYYKNQDFMQNKFNKIDNIHVIGNPAYDNGKDKLFYTRFIKNSYDLLQDGGTITLVCPFDWIKRKLRLFKDMCKTGYFEKIQQIRGEDAFGINMGAPLCIFIYRLGGDKRGHADIEYVNKLSEVESSILQKLTSGDIKAKKGKGSTTGKNPEFNYTKTESHIYPVYLSSDPGDSKGGEQRREVFASSLNDAKGFGVSKFICSHILAPKNVNHFCEFNKEKGVGRYAAYFECSELEANNIKLYFSSKVYHFINKYKRSAGETGYAYLRIPKLDWTREWKEQDLYKYFNLTEEEIIFLENRIK